MRNGPLGDPRSRSRPREGVAHGAVPGGRERRAKPTEQPRADGPAGGPLVNAAASATEIERLLFDHISDAVFTTHRTSCRLGPRSATVPGSLEAVVATVERWSWSSCRQTKACTLLSEADLHDTAAIVHLSCWPAIMRVCRFHAGSGRSTREGKV